MTGGLTFSGIAISNNSAYIAGQKNGPVAALYVVDDLNNIPLTLDPIATDPNGSILAGIAIKDTTAYIVGQDHKLNGHLYVVDLTNIPLTLNYTSTAGQGLIGIAVSENSAYIVGIDTYGFGALYYIRRSKSDSFFSRSGGPRSI